MIRYQQAFAALLVAGLLAACSGSSHTTSPTTPVTSPSSSSPRTTPDSHTAAAQGFAAQLPSGWLVQATSGHGVTLAESDADLTAASPTSLRLIANPVTGGQSAPAAVLAASSKLGAVGTVTTTQLGVSGHVATSVVWSAGGETTQMILVDAAKGRAYMLTFQAPDTVWVAATGVRLRLLASVRLDARQIPPAK